MAKRKQLKPRKPKSKMNGIVYLLSIELDGRLLHKIGTTNKSALKRMLQIAEDIHYHYGYIPRMSIVKEQSTHDNYQVEAALLDAMKEYQYYPVNEFNGWTEIVDCNKDILLAAYDKAVNDDYPVVERDMIVI